jgi:hypothetical protein
VFIGAGAHEAEHESGESNANGVLHGCLCVCVAFQGKAQASGGVA